MDIRKGGDPFWMNQQIDEICESSDKIFGAMLLIDAKVRAQVLGEVFATLVAKVRANSGNDDPGWMQRAFLETYQEINASWRDADEKRSQFQARLNKFF